MNTTKSNNMSNNISKVISTSKIKTTNNYINKSKFKSKSKSESKSESELIINEFIKIDKLNTTNKFNHNDSNINIIETNIDTDTDTDAKIDIKINNKQNEKFESNVNLNPLQKQIVMDDLFLKQKQALCIVACAGSGKTTTIINKVIYMIKYLGLNPKEFILTTFTKNAAQEMIHRISQYLPADIMSELTIGTFHSIALKQITYNDYKIDEMKPEPMPEEYLIKYSELLSSEKYSNPYKYVFIDEYQDINQLQYEIISKWYEKLKLLIVVGDDQQNIYTFRNTSIKYILNFCEEFKGEYKYLTINYRCNLGIVNMSNAIIQFNKDRIDKEIKSGNLDQPIKPKIRFFQNESNEKDYLLKYIQKLNKLTFESSNISNTSNSSNSTNSSNLTNLSNSSNLTNSSNSSNSPNIKINKTTLAILCRSNIKLFKVENFLTMNQIHTQILDAANQNILNCQNQHMQYDNYQKINIVLSTIHASKGLEFDYVYIINCVDGSFPVIGADLQEERRLFYVACTRAKKELIITSLWFDKYKPSRFIRELYDMKSKIVDFMNFTWPVNQYEENLQKKKCTLKNYIYNLDVDTFIHLKTNNIIPSEKYHIFNVENIHLSIIPEQIINNRLIDANVLFEQMLNIHVNRMIYEIIYKDDFISIPSYTYLPYISNNTLILNTKFTLKSAIHKWIQTDDSNELIKHISYFKQKKAFDLLPMSKPILVNLFGILSDPDFYGIDLANITKNNNIILENSNLKFSNRNLRSIDIIDDIFNLSIFEEILKGRYSLQFLLSNIDYVDKTSLIEHLINIHEWLKTNIELAIFVRSNYDIIINKSFIGQINLILDNRIIIIEARISPKPSITDFIRYLIYWSKFNLDNPDFNTNVIIYYNPLIGRTYEWNFSNLNYLIYNNNIINYFNQLF